MCFFKKWRQKRKAKKMQDQSVHKETESKEDKYTAEDERIDLKEKIDDIKKEDDNTDAPEEETVEKLKIRPFSKPKVSNQEPEWPKKEEKKEEVNESKTHHKKVSEDSGSRKYTGKYEVYPEANAYKFRLKASNGEVLAASFRYSTEKGAQSGIATFKKNVEEGQFTIVTDKNGYSQFRLFNASGARVIISGEVYQTVQKVESAIESVKNFYHTDKIEVLEELPKSEVREEAIVFEPVDEIGNGKYEIFNEEDAYFVRLKASNAQVLFVSQGYASKASAKNGLKTIKKAIEDKNFTVEKDKQDRFQFHLHSSNGQLILTGESYPVKNNCISAAHSVLKFGLKAPVVEL
ncbi:YegP family protein [Mycoplasmatota bacterium]|nr:YegP family protein [Mycoplasmatota bacterium]